MLQLFWALKCQSKVPGCTIKFKTGSSLDPEHCHHSCVFPVSQLLLLPSTERGSVRPSYHFQSVGSLSGCCWILLNFTGVGFNPNPQQEVLSVGVRALFLQAHLCMSPSSGMGSSECSPPAPCQLPLSSCCLEFPFPCAHLASGPPALNALSSHPAISTLGYSAFPWGIHSLCFLSWAAVRSILSTWKGLAWGSPHCSSFSPQDVCERSVGLAEPIISPELVEAAALWVEF